MRYMAASNQWLSDHGLEHQDYVGVSHYELSPEIPEHGKALHRRALDGEAIVSYDDDVDQTEATRTWLKREIMPLRDAGGTVRGLAIFAKNISPDIEPQIRFIEQARVLDETIRRRTAELERSERRFRSAFENFPIGLVIYSSEGTIETFNAGAEAIFGWNAADAVGRNVSTLLADGLPGDRDAELKHLFQTADPKVAGRPIDAIGLRKNGDAFPVQMRVGAIDTGEDGSYLGALTDATEIKALQEQLLRAQKMDAMGLLTGGIAHDFNNILGIIMGNLEILRLEIDENSPAVKLIDSALAGTTRGAEITRKLMVFSQGENPVSGLHHLNDIIRGFDELLQRSLTASIDVELALTDPLWPVEIDPGGFEETILNLALNARDAMPEGGSLIIETANKWLDEACASHNSQSQAGEFVMISVSDTGCGMSEHVKAKGFEPFFTTKPRGTSTGLGLAMVYGFVKRSGGHMKIYSEIGEGTTIRLFLPRARLGEVTETPAEDTHAPLPRGHETILVVDDEPGLIAIAAAVLERLGYTVRHASDGSQALRLLRQHDDIDLLFSDVVMPGGIDGYKLTTLARDIHPGLRALLTSGFTPKHEEHSQSSRGEWTRLKANLLGKPYNQAELAVAIRAALDAGEDPALG
ncbi:PAS domain S-box protein [Breoghania sp. L-A4]|nr:PAS domain S-box protein [Breoghania sp. L-A4]